MVKKNFLKMVQLVRRALRSPAPTDFVQQRGDSDEPPEGLGELVHPLGVHVSDELCNLLPLDGLDDAALHLLDATGQSRVVHVLEHGGVALVHGHLRVEVMVLFQQILIELCIRCLTCVVNKVVRLNYSS